MPSSYPAGTVPNLTNEDLAGRRPYHLPAGMQVIAEFSLVDAHLGRLMTAMLGASPREGAAIFGTLRGAKLQRDAMNAVAREVLSPDDQKRLRSLQDLVKQASDFRDQIAHRLWMMDEALPDAVVLFDPGQIWRSDLKARDLGARERIDDADAISIQQAWANASNIWKLADFERARLACVHAVVATQALTEALHSELGSSDRKKHYETFSNAIVLSKG